MSGDRDSAALAAFWGAWEQSRLIEHYDYHPAGDDEAEPAKEEKEDPGIKTNEHRCWDHAEPAPIECQDFDYVCRFCGAPLRSDSWYKHQE